MKRALGAVAVLLLLLSACGSGGPAEGRARHPGVRSDFDGDGYGDLVVGDTTATVHGKYAAGYVAVLRGSAHGPRIKKPQVVTQDDLGFGKAGQGGAFGGAGTVTADLDGDGRADLVTQAGRDTLFVVWGSEKGLSGAAAARMTGSAPLAGNVDGDGHADLVVGPAQGDSEVNTVRVLLGPFSREGTPRRTVSLDLRPSDPRYPVAVPSALGDVTGDGKDDLVVSWSILADYAPVPRATVLYRGTADGRLVKGPRLPDGFYGSLVTADINHDGHDDVVAGLSCEMLGDVSIPVGGSRLTVLYGGTMKTTRITADTPGLPVEGPFSPCTFGGGPVVGDADGDGYADVAFSAETRAGQRQVVLLRGSAAGLTTEGARAVPGGFAVLLDTDGGKAANLVVDDHGEIRVWRGESQLLAFTAADLHLGPGISGSGHGLSPVG
ncbi:FG-GAP repeat domain-containing protein [Streptomyces griseorubiginosus]|uniref:FG-GAP repeat domain-containing protein n=1 Tax=Streptomyces griseorubiginosus TaxID=67304 RepID=UPI001AD767E6|nr:VCBS repeat-containing protein [Streptomyces griseorubiginosus]MBO4257707.1 hypothetical protein [Streptomyces griseorubiginosus]